MCWENATAGKSATRKRYRNRFAKRNLKGGDGRTRGLHDGHRTSRMPRAERCVALIDQTAGLSDRMERLRMPGKLRLDRPLFSSRLSRARNVDHHRSVQTCGSTSVTQRQTNQRQGPVQPSQSGAPYGLGSMSRFGRSNIAGGSERQSATLSTMGPSGSHSQAVDKSQAYVNNYSRLQAGALWPHKQPLVISPRCANNLKHENLRFSNNRIRH